eukprot:12896750-Ditylum_brightwellii.AAC.1
MGDMVMGMEDTEMGDVADATLLQLEIPKINMMKTHLRLAIATVVTKMGVALAVTITFYPCHKMHKGCTQEECCHPTLTQIRNPTCHMP